MSYAQTMSSSKRKIAIWLLIGGGLVLLGAANGHLVYVATMSQPECVAHVRQGDGNGSQHEFSAAKSSCSPLQGASR